MKITEFWHRATQFLLRQLFPPRCVGCDDYLADAQLACEQCRHAVFGIEGPICLICGDPRTQVQHGYAGVSEHCGRCLNHRPRFESARACWEYSGVVAEAIQRTKYRGQLWALRSLARELRPWLVTELEALGDQEPLVTGVPMHPADLRRRGFNPALMLARLALPRHQVVTNVLSKVRKTPAQAGLSRSERMVNLRGAFELSRPKLVEDRTVVLIDDVMTTGATAGELAKVLRNGGARRVVVFTAARTVSF